MIGIHNLSTKAVKQIIYKVACPWLFGLPKAESVSNRISSDLWEWTAIFRGHGNKSMRELH